MVIFHNLEHILLDYERLPQIWTHFPRCQPQVKFPEKRQLMGGGGLISPRAIVLKCSTEMSFVIVVP